MICKYNIVKSGLISQFNSNCNIRLETFLRLLFVGPYFITSLWFSLALASRGTVISAGQFLPRFHGGPGGHGVPWTDGLSIFRAASANRQRKTNTERCYLHTDRSGMPTRVLPINKAFGPMEWRGIHTSSKVLWSFVGLGPLFSGA